MSGLIALAVGPAFLVGTGVSAEPSDFTPRDAVEFTPRGGLPNFLAKLKRGEPVKIAYFGGSITAQTGWRVQSRKWLQEQFPEAEISEIHAAIGGTGSSLGVFRLEADALNDKPDLLFVEFAVNDAAASPESIRKAMEGIVRKTWRLLPETDICFVYTVTAKDTPGLAAGKMKRSESVMEEIADHYAIPSVHMGVEVARIEKDGKLVMQSADSLMTRVSGDELNEAAAMATDTEGRIIFSKDGVHPYPETGHVLYTQALTRSLEKLDGIGTAGPHVLPEPLISDNWEGAKQIPLDQAGGVFDGEFTKLDPKSDAIAKAFADRLVGMWKFEPGASFTFKFKGTKAAIYDILGPEGARVELTVNGNSREVTRFDKYCTYNRLNTLGIGENMPDQVYEIKVTVMDEKFDKGAVLAERNAEDFTKSPEKYTPTNWYAGSIFIVGDLVE